MNNLLPKIAGAAVVLITASLALARPWRPNQIPNGTINACANCHIDPNGGGPRNPFGKTVEAGFLTPGGDVIWGPALASLDSDHDGVSNGFELQDSNGIWSIGQPAPGTQSLVSKPGDPFSKPLAILTLHFSGMTPHVGQKLEVRAVDKASSLEAVRTVLPSIPDAAFDLMPGQLTLGRSYFIDFYADLNGNGVYDAPPTDHAWRLELDQVTGDTTLNFVHNTTFTDIHWNYLLTMTFSNMNPHVGQKLEVRVLELNSKKEIGRTALPSISVPNFMFTIPGLEIGNSYQVDFYADLNKNGFYDTPPTDHAWRMQLDDVTGDASLNFIHNTQFTEIDWGYLFTLELSNMTPHIGQLFELRVVDESDGSEVGRTFVPSILQPNFSVQVGGIKIGKSYNVDYYADLNKNGQYDTPPTDHAWRTLFTNSIGDTTLTFVHNTTFTDIQWPGEAIVEPNPASQMPRDFVLGQNYPNPFNPETKINFAIPNTGAVSLNIFNTVSQQVRTLVSGSLPAGQYTATWDGLDDLGRQLSSGIFFCRLETEGFAKTIRMVLMR
jgi:hypothetical protein